MPDVVSTERIAIVGLGGIFPGAADLETFWRNIANGVDSGQPVPTGRWYLSPDKAYSPWPPKPDRVYSTWGCFIEGFSLDPAGLDLDPDLLLRLDPMFHLSLHAARGAFIDARRLRGTDPARIGVILGNIALPTESTSGLCRDILGRTFVENLIDSTPLPDEERRALKAGLKRSDWHPLNRFAAGLPSSLICQALGLKGSAYTLDAACASSLYALKFASEELLAHRADAMLAGGISRPDCQYTQMGFSQLQALSKSGRCAPLSAAADGLVVGEGAGIFVLKRLADAVQASDQIYGVIAGIGLSNDRGANLLAPHSEGQLRAMRTAYKQAEWRPNDVDLIECHATGTPVGDAVEIASLHELWRHESSRPHQCIIGGVKSNVGHLLTAAGSAGLMKVLLAMRHRILPPTANFEQPAEMLASPDSPFEILKTSQPWPERIDGSPRRATINAFGFGGINAHLLVEEWRIGVRPSFSDSPEIARPACETQLVAIVGQQEYFGASASKGSDSEETCTSPQQGVSSGGWGAEQTDWFQREERPDVSANTRGVPTETQGPVIRELRLPVSQFRIPPVELQDMLPQQQLMLKVAAGAIRDSQRAGTHEPHSACRTSSRPEDREQPIPVHNRPESSSASRLSAADPWFAVTDDPTRTGVFIGIELDPNTTNFHLRWSIEQDASQWAEMLGLNLAPQDFDRWIAQLKEAASPALTANRVMGNLGGIVASRLAREFDVGGPSFTISAGGDSGGVAFDLAVGALQRGELDRAIVGAVDLPSDIRTALWGREVISPDGATAFVLKRLDDAWRDLDRVQSIGRVISCPDQRRSSNTPPPPHEAFNATSVTSTLRTLLAGLSRQQNRTAVDSDNKTTTPVQIVNRAEISNDLLVKLHGNALPIGFLISPFQGTTTGPCGRSLRAGLFIVDGESTDDIAIQLQALSNHIDVTRPVEHLAERWFNARPPDPQRRLAVSLLVRTPEELKDVLAIAQTQLRGEARSHVADPRVFFSQQPLGHAGRLSFVFPGSGNVFLKMGHDLLAAFPEVLQRQHAENRQLRDQFRPNLAWEANSTSRLLADHKAMIFSQVAIGTAICDLLAMLGVFPSASIGYSLGESAALFALRAWTDRDEMLHRLNQSPLFGSDLVAPFDAARKVWNIEHGQDVPWISGTIDRSCHQIRTALRGRDRVYLLIINTPTQCVIGGDRSQVSQLASELGAQFVPFPAPSSVHCVVLREVEQAYRTLHLLPIKESPIPTWAECDPDSRDASCLPPAASTNFGPSSIDYYSTAWGHTYELTQDSAAEAIVSQAVTTIDFPQVVQQAYADGVRLFVEIGPGSSCTKWITEILGDKPHLVRAALPATADPIGNFLALLAALIAERVPVDLFCLYGKPVNENRNTSISPTASDVVTRLNGKPFEIPIPPAGWVLKPVPSVPRSTVAPLLAQLQLMNNHRTETHEAFLRFSARTEILAAEHLAALAAVDAMIPAKKHEQAKPSTIRDDTPKLSDVPPTSLTREQCLMFAMGPIGDVLGTKFAAIDAHPSRVRLPNEPLMLVDRILRIEGVPLSMSAGRIVTEHDIKPGAWYLDSERIPTCIAVESGQADLFLSGWLGIDVETKGLAKYRLLDAVVTFHDALPGPGNVIRYDIRILNFFRQGLTYLFRFEFDATVDGRPLLTMREGCAGFFTEADLAQGRGVIHTALDRQPRPGKRPADWREPVPMSVESYDDSQLLALRQGKLSTCFGPLFSGLSLRNPTTIPGILPNESVGSGGHSPTSTPRRSPMWLIDRVLKLDPCGGKYGIGSILGELDIHPDDWFLTCHFCDDPVMPGTLMYECCLHTLRIFLLRMGWIGEQREVIYEPIPEIRSRLKCRGQVLGSTRKVWYEVTLKEVGYGPDAYCLADALMYADGKPIVEISDMSVRLSGLTSLKVTHLWANKRIPSVGNQGTGIPPSRGSNSTSGRQRGSPISAYDIRPGLFDSARITAFAIGKPSDAFGERYRVFDDQRQIARLPGPPFQFLDRIVSIKNCQPWILEAGGEIVAQYDIPVDAWYFAANRQQTIPFAILLETALQPCGWLAGYLGSALKSETDLSFRNLGGKATQLRQVTAGSGTLTTTVKITRVSQSGGIIIQNFDYALSCNGQPVYVGNTYFGFFSKASLKNQLGIREAQPFRPSSEDSARAKRFDSPDTAPFANPSFQMVDRVELSCDGGPHGLGYARGTMQVNPNLWFFKAHFYQDPVVPGSLGLESFFQLLKFYAVARWDLGADTQFATPSLTCDPATSNPPAHEWIYRGQVVPGDELVTVTAVIQSVDQAHRQVMAEGYLSVDGRVIYHIKHFTIQVLADA